MRQTLQNPPAKSIRPTVLVAETEPEPLAQRQSASVKNRFSARMKRFDKIYAAMALYISLLFPLGLIASISGNFITSISANWLPANTQPSIFLSSALSIFAILFSLAGCVAGNLLFRVAPKSGRISIAIGGLLFYVTTFWTYFYPAFLSLQMEGRFNSLTFNVNVADSFIMAFPHIAAYLCFVNSRKKKLKANHGGS